MIEEKENAKAVQTKKALTSRGILLIGIGGLLVVLLIVGGIAWYTRITTNRQITMDAAKFDFKADYASGDYIIRADDYISLYGENKVAPGTIGVIPIKVSLGESEVDVKYVLNMNTEAMDEAFQKRIRFFYIPAGKEYSIENEVTLGGSEGIEGTLSRGTKSDEDHTEFIYWEWVYDLNPQRFYDANNDKWYVAKSKDQKEEYESTFAGLFGAKDSTQRKSAIDEFDKLDTDISRGVYNSKFPKTGSTTEEYESESQTLYKVDSEGKYTEETGTLKAYQKAMESKIDISGAMAEPVYNKNKQNQPTTTGTYGSQYVDLNTIIAAHNDVYK